MPLIACGLCLWSSPCKATLTPWLTFIPRSLAARRHHPLRARVRVCRLAWLHAGVGCRPLGLERGRAAEQRPRRITRCACARACHRTQPLPHRSGRESIKPLRIETSPASSCARGKIAQLARAPPARVQQSRKPWKRSSTSLQRAGVTGASCGAVAGAVNARSHRALRRCTRRAARVLRPDRQPAGAVQRSPSQHRSAESGRAHRYDGVCTRRGGARFGSAPAARMRCSTMRLLAAGSRMCTCSPAPPPRR